MNDYTRRLALRAAARVALGATFSFGMVGCGDGTDIQVPSAESATPSDGDAQIPPDNDARIVTDDDAPIVTDNDAPIMTDNTTPIDSAIADATLVDPAEAKDGRSATDAADASDSPLACVGSVTLVTFARMSPDAMTTEVTGAELSCCLAYGDSYISDGGTSLDAAKQDPQLVACCTAVIARIELHGEDYRAVSAPLRRVCCLDDVVAPKEELYAYRLCTPWGPPVPPAMAREDEELA